MSNGLYIVIEGPEGVGKSTQVEKLANKFTELGRSVRLFREPDSQSDLTARVLRRLTQDPHYPMNTRTEVLLYNAARSQSLEVIRRARANGTVCLVDRNYLTTLAIQYYGRGDVPDYEMITTIINFAVGDMQPDKTIILDAPVNVLQERAKQRGSGERFDNLDLEFLERVRAGYLWEAKQRGYPVVHAIGSVDDITAELWGLLAGAESTKTDVPLEVPPPPSTTTPLKELITAKQESLDMQALLDKDENGNYSITDAGTNYLKQVLTNTTGNVYAFTQNINPVTVAAAMARLSRRGDDMRITLLDEFAAHHGKDEGLLKRVITAYGDDSVQQLVGQHVVVENASNLLTKKLEWGRLASYLEQSTRYIYFDKKDVNGNFRYYTPKELTGELEKSYRAKMDDIFEHYSVLARKLTEYIQKHSDVAESERDGAWRSATRAQACDAIRPVLPVATTSTVGIYASGQALESLIMHLLSDEMPEAATTGQLLLDEGRKVIPVFLERADKPDRGGAMIAYRANTAKSVRKLADDLLPQSISPETESVTLTDYWPKNELDLVADMLYEHSHLPLETIRETAKSWHYQQKRKVVNEYMGERLNRRHRPGRALEKAHYSFDLVCDYGIFRDLQRHRMVDDMQWQLLTPRYGYDVPELVEKAGLSELFENCFDISLALHSELQSAGYDLAAQYATLLGHKMRWKVTFNARQAFHMLELRTTPQGHPGYRKLSKEMYDKIAEIHPLIGQAMKFVNQDEDPELTRLAAERYTQFKLQQLDS